MDVRLITPRQPLSVQVMTLGIVGSLLCVFQRSFTAKPGETSLSIYKALPSLIASRFRRKTAPHLSDAEMTELHGAVSNSQDPSHLDSSSDGSVDIADTESTNGKGGTQKSLREVVRSTLIATGKVFFPFCMLSVSYSLWFITQKAFNSKFRVNVFGFTALEKVLSPFYMWPFLLIIDFLGPVKRCFHSSSVTDMEESFPSAVRGMFKQASANKGRGWLMVFLYRFFINTRSIGYFYLSVMYDLQLVYLQLTLIRTLLGWVSAIVVCVIFPKFISLSPAEKFNVLHPGNLTSKFIGSLLVIVALILSKKS